MCILFVMTPPTDALGMLSMNVYKNELYYQSYYIYIEFKRSKPARTSGAFIKHALEA